MDLGMGMGMAGFVEDLDQLLATMSFGSSATSSAPIAAAPPAAADLRRGPWTVDEDIRLVDYITAHGEGRWNSLARSAGLKRIGKSCRLRWLNYLRPDVRRGNITAEEQLLILDLHLRWGNRWSKIAQHLPGRTDNEVKNYWRTRVQKQARHLRCDVNSAHFRHVVRHVWMPRLQERAQADREDHQGVHAAIEAHHQYYSEGPPGWTAAATALRRPDDASSALPAPSSFTADDASNYTAAYTSAARSAATATPTTNDQQGCRPVVLHQCGADDARTGPTTTDAAGDDDVFAGTTWSELLATTTGGPDNDSSSMSMIGLQLQDFGFGDFEDGLWSLDDLCCADQLNC